MTYALTWLPQVLTAAGLKVQMEPGWETRGHGDVGKILGVLCHHNACIHASNPSDADEVSDIALIRDGRPDLAGPLSQLFLDIDGVYTVVAAGKCWHAGGGTWEGINDGNRQMIGIEADNAGLNNIIWPAPQIDAYARGVAAILKHIGAGAIMCAGHKEYARPHGRKSDPDFDMGWFRGLVAEHLGATPKPLPITLKVGGVSPDTLNLRSTPNGVKIAALAEGTVVDRLAVSGNWSQVRAAGLTGWAFSKYLIAV